MGDGAVGEEFEFRDKHGCYAVEGGGAFFLDREQGSGRVEGFGGEENSGTVRGSCHVAEDAAEAVEERGWAADYVSREQAHSGTDEVSVVEDGVVG